jgi:cytochrome P450 family 4
MGVKLGELGNDGIAYRERIYEVGKLLMFRLMRPWLHINFFYSLFGYLQELKDVLKPVHEFTKSIIKQRKLHFHSAETKQDSEGLRSDENVYFRSKKRRFAMMDMLLQAQKDGLIDDEGINEETDTFTFEGHDTTSAGMTFTLLLLAHHPEAQEKIFEEMQKVLVENDRDELTIEDFNKMDYLDRVVKESMRIYPPVPVISRVFSEDFYHDGVVLPKGSACHIYIYDIHRDSDVFPDPEKFDPDRFLPENCANRSNFAFIPFSAGMRNCIGQRFALLELKVMLTKIIKNFKIFPITTREEIVFIADLVLRCKTQIKMKFKLRE